MKTSFSAKERDVGWVFLNEYNALYMVTFFHNSDLDKMHHIRRKNVMVWYHVTTSENFNYSNKFELYFSTFDRNEIRF